MNHWQESAEILARLAELAAAGQRAALATVVSIAGSAYRRPGAKLLIEEAGGTVGSVSGGCLEADVREVAREVIASGRPSLRHYNTGADEDVVWGLGLGCNGLVDVLVQPASAGPLADLADRLRELFAGEGAFALATVVDGEELGASLVVGPGDAVAGSLMERGAATGPAREAGWPGPAGARQGLPASPAAADLDRLVVEHARGLVAAGRSGVQRIAGREVFVEVLPPPPHLIVCGAGDDARPLVAYAADAGFRVTVVDHRAGLMAPGGGLIGGEGSAAAPAIGGTPCKSEWFPKAARLIVARPDEPELALPPAAHSLAVVKTHSLAHDREWVRRLLAAGLPFVGVLGPRARTEAILKDLAAGRVGSAGSQPGAGSPTGSAGSLPGAGAGTPGRSAAAPAIGGTPGRSAAAPAIGGTPGRSAAAPAIGGTPGRSGESGKDAKGRVFGPVGLDLGADGPRQVALSIVAELLAFVAGREPHHLRERREGIHAEPREKALHAR
ncbi:MAG TPA: XdhC/CoxI family protein [Thermoanaerobaculia bacterium]|nr:XdhC/CoxI family protein [Thermoanaerobaculia bacterium]